MKKSIKKAVLLSATTLMLAFPATLAGCKNMKDPKDSSSSFTSQTGFVEDTFTEAAVLRQGSSGRGWIFRTR